MTDTQERMDAAAIDWVRRIPVDQIPCVLAFLSARLLAEGVSSHSCEHNGESARDAENLLTAGELAERLSLRESWVRTEERAGRIPSVRLGRYVRFRLSAIERALADRQGQRA
jgi:excisionase family DNA binding protein